MDVPNKSFSGKEKLEIDDEIDKMRGSIADIICSAEKAGAEVSDLVEEWMGIASKIINAKKKLR